MIELFSYEGFVFSYAEYAYIAIGLGMIISLFLTETIGVMAGGIIVPGYFALYLQNPIQIVTTFLIGIVTYYIIYFMSKYLLIYGRRRLILCLLQAFGAQKRTWMAPGALCQTVAPFLLLLMEKNC